MTLPAAVQEEMQERFGDRVRFGEPLARHTSLRVGGTADALVVVDTVSEVQAVVRLAAERRLPTLVIGGGSNMLVADRGVRGIVLRLGRGLAAVAWEAREGGAVVRAGAGVALRRLALEAAARGYGGLEFAEGIPGSLGGALLMNAGAFGGELAAIVEAVEGVAADGAFLRLGRAGLHFRYRRVDLPREMVVTGVVLHLEGLVPEEARARMDAHRRRRVATQPVELPSAGSMFKNPVGDHAGRLVEAVGLKGAVLGRAQISQQHANFIVNLGGARADEVKGLMDLAQRAVWERFGVWLEPEVRLLGEW